MKKIYYKKGFKYQLASPYICFIDIKPEKIIKTKYIILYPNGKLIIKAGYAWDGASGPTIDTKNFMRGPLVHDALYQLIRMQKLLMSDRSKADDELHKMCREDGMSRFRAWYVRRSMRTSFAKSAALPENLKKILTAP